MEGSQGTWAGRRAAAEKLADCGIEVAASMLVAA